MASTVELFFTHQPSLFRSYTQGLFKWHRGLKNGGKVPDFTLSRKDFKINGTHLKKFNIQCELPTDSSVSILYPLTLVFPIVMRIMSHRKFPLNYPSMLQLRNHIIYHKQMDTNETFDISSKISAQRYVKKGIEIDIESVIEANDQIYWENVNTYFFRLRSETEDSPPELAMLSALSDFEDTLDLPCPPRNGWKWAKVSGDYNGIHYTKSYAKLMGFKSDFIHPHRLLTHVLHKTSKLYNENPQRIDILLKGPVFYNTDVVMKLKNNEDGVRFDVHCSDNDRPGICVEMRNAASGSRLLN